MHKQQRPQERFAELPVSNPRFAFSIYLKRKRINKNRLAFVKLNIKRRCIFKYHTFLQSFVCNLQCKQGGIFPHIKTPLVRITDKWNLLGQQYKAFGKIKILNLGNLLVWYQPAFFYQYIIQATAHQLGIMHFVNRVNIAVNLAMLLKNKTAVVSVRSRMHLYELIGLFYLVAYSGWSLPSFFSGFLPVKNDFMVSQKFLKKKLTPSTAAIITCKM